MGLKDFLDNLFKSKSVHKNTLNSFEEMGNSEEQLNYESTAKPQNNAPTTESFGERAKDFVEGTIDEVKEQGSALLEEIKEQYNNLDEATKEYRAAISKKASETFERIESFVDHTVEKAKQMEVEDQAKDQNKDGIADQAPDLGKPLQEQHKSFFDKAETWVNKHDAKSDDQENHSSGHVQRVIEPLELPKDPDEPFNSKS